MAQAVCTGTALAACIGTALAACVIGTAPVA
uniref:Uncharacterized protein n=1 Tax=viral metagenome TaxID=1070528 RepID=A0A6C0E6L7_9ZZZZ